MALACVVCHSDECQWLGHVAQCRNCNAHFDPNTGEVHTVTFGGSPLPVPNPPEEPAMETPPEEVPAEPAPEPEPQPI